MSLLMDALKRAETSKQEAQRAAAGAIGREAIPANADNLSLEPLAGASTVSYTHLTLPTILLV